MDKQFFSDEQLIFISSNFGKVHGKMTAVFNAIAESDGIIIGDINSVAAVGDFVRDKCIAALQLPGLIYKEEQGTAKMYKLTTEGIRLKELLRKGR